MCDSCSAWCLVNLLSAADAGLEFALLPQHLHREGRTTWSGDGSFVGRENCSAWGSKKHLFRNMKFTIKDVLSCIYAHISPPSINRSIAARVCMHMYKYRCIPTKHPLPSQDKGSKGQPSAVLYNTHVRLAHHLNSPSLMLMKMV